uniref:Uncharacterized protein n=1 Tax=Heterorhabditis bacteriophora TaxID=37862 RepID=A0A1I7X0R9_HETBA
MGTEPNQINLLTLPISSTPSEFPYEVFRYRNDLAQFFLLAFNMCV